MADSLSTAQLERLGKRLIAADTPLESDLRVLHELLATRSDLLDGAVARVRGELALAPTSRVKNTETILEKLRRQGGWALGTMQDIAGMRVVGDFDRTGQDDVVAELVRVFDREERQPKVVDRRIAPMHGYRAVHVVVFPGGAPLEIQVRTMLQHEWAEVFEKLADRTGRGIRYGEAPTLPSTMSPSFAERYGRLVATTVKVMLTVADTIDQHERGELDADLDIEVMWSGIRRYVETTLMLADLSSG